MRPPKVDSNAYSYHLRALQKDKLVEKGDEGYRLSPSGLAYVDKVSIEKFEPRIQPKLTHMLVIRNNKDQILLISKSKQPFIHTWMLPYGKVHLEDRTFFDAAVREADEKLNFRPLGMSHVGSCYIRASIQGELVSSIVANIFTGFAENDAPLGPDAQWFDESELQELRLAPAVKEVMSQASGGTHFQQYDVEW